MQHLPRGHVGLCEKEAMNRAHLARAETLGQNHCSSISTMSRSVHCLEGPSKKAGVDPGGAKFPESSNQECDERSQTSDDPIKRTKGRQVGIQRSGPPPLGFRHWKMIWKEGRVTDL